MQKRYLAGEAGGITKMNAFFVTNLGKPQPEISRSGKRRNANLGEGIRLIRSDERLVLRKRKASIFPIQ